MTTEEAIYQLEFLLYDDESYGLDEIEALNIAIETLKEKGENEKMNYDYFISWYYRDEESTQPAIGNDVVSSQNELTAEDTNRIRSEIKEQYNLKSAPVILCIFQLKYTPDKERG